MLKLKDKNKNLVAGLINYKDLCIENILATGDKKLSFSLHKEDKFYNLIEEECYIETKEAEFVIKARDVGIDYTRFDCVLNLEELEANIFDRFESVEQTITASLNLAIVGTGWTVNDNTLKKKRTVRCTNKNALEIVQEIKKTYRVDIVFNTLKREIEVYEHLGEDKGTYFIDSLNLTALQVQSDSYKFATRIIAEGKDGLTFSSINNGKNYVENYQYSNKIKTIYWKDERYTVKESLLEDAKAKLEELSKPFTSYNASVLNLAELNPKYKSILDYSLGDTITLLSKSNKVKDKQRIVKTIEWPQDHTKDTVELANATLKFEDIQQENQETTDTVSNITVDNGTVDGSTIDSIQVKQIEDFKANVIEVVNLKAINASIDNLHANKADIQDLHAVTAKIGTLEATKANITQLNATNAEISKLNAIKANITDLNAANGKISILESKTASIDNLVSQKASINDLKALNATISDALIKKATIAQLEALETKTNNLIADKANIKDLNVTNANINKIQAETASIKTLLNGNLSSENIQAGGITSDKLTIANGFITNLMISSVSASKITAGTIDAAKINVVNLNADNLTVGKINGQLLKDGSISGLAIENGAIDNSKVSSNANIEASKINISSVVTAINDGSTLLTANKVAIDSEKGTLDVAFNKLNTSLEANKKATESNLTAINVVQGKLSASIENSKILEGKQKTLEDNYNRTVATVDSLKNTIGEQKTLIDSATGKITSVEVKANTLEKNLNGLTQTVTDTKKVIENNKTVLESKNAELKANIDSVSSSLSSVSSTVDKNNKTLVAKTNTLEQNLNGLTQTVANNKTVIEGKITSVEGETHELKAGLGGLTSKLDTLKSTTDGINKTVSNQGSAINQLKDSINLKVDSSTFTQSTQTINNNINKAKEDAINTANSNTNNAINNIAIGGRNLVLNSMVNETSTNYGFAFRSLINLEKEKEYILSVNGRTNGYSNGSKFLQVFIYDKNWKWSSGIAITEAIDTTKSIKFKVPSSINPADIVLTSYYYPNENKVTGSATLNWYKVEEGNKATSWTPAPEDLKKYSDDVAKAKADLAQANAIVNADGKITEEERKRIQQAQENLNTAIAKANDAETKAKSYADTKKIEAIKEAENLALEKSNLAKKYAEEVATAKANLAKTEAIANADGKISAEEQKRIQQAQENLNTAISKADKAKQDAINEANRVAELKKQEAISSANSHADSKANEALNNAKAFVNTEITTVNSHLNKATSEINILKGQIESKVSQSDIDKSIQNIKFNDVNMILNSGEFKDTDHWSCTNGSNNLTIENRILKFKFTNYASWGCYISNNSLLNKPLDISKKYTVVCKLKASKNQILTFNICDGNSYNYVFGKELSLTTEWQIFKFTFNPTQVGNERQFRFITSNLGYDFDFYIEFVKMVEGATSSDSWSMAPDYVLDNIKTVTDKITTVESKLTQENNSIKASVQDLNSTTQTITTNVSNINRDLTSKINSNLDAAKSFATDIAIAKANLAKEQAIANADGKITEEERKRIQQAQENLNVAIARADKAKQEAINSANSHADSKANEALNNAKAYTNAEITTVNSKVHNVESNLNILSDKINTKVSQSDIDKSISEMKFNDVNMIINSGRFENINHWGITNGNQNLLIKDKVLVARFNNYASWGLYVMNDSLKNKKLDVTKDYTVVCKLKASRNQTLSFNICDGNSNNYVYSKDLNITTEWEIFKFTFKPASIGNERQFRFITGNLGYDFDFYIDFVKMVEGATSSDVWSPAPEDTNDLVLDNIKVVNTKISDVSSSVTQLRDSVTTDIRAINSKTQSIETTLNGKASKQEVTEVNNRVATIKASLDSITQRVSSTESKTQTLESNINGKASKQEVNNVSSKVVSLETNLNGITNRVSNTESRINTLNGQVANAVTIQQFTEFKQSNKDFQLKISQTTNLHNLVPNGTFAGGLREWICGGEFWNGSYTGYGFSGKICGAVKNKSTSEKFLTSYKAFKVEKNTTYTLNFHYKVEQNVQSMEAFVMLSNTESGDYGQIIKVMQALGGERSDLTNDIPHSFTFNTGNFEWVWLRFDHNGMKPGTNWDEYCWLYISEVAVYKGSVGAVKYLPKSGENYDTTFLFDGMGFQGNFDDGSYAYLGKEGLEWYNAGTGHAYHALTYVTSFDIPIGNPGKAYIRLPAEFTKRRSSLKWTVALRGYYYNTTGNFFPFHIHCTGGRDYIENGLVVCEVQGYCKIQNAQNAGDIQFRPLTAMLIAIA
ncbi:phage tail spike protein [Clostridium perfringens]|uniref:phage tail spike protein n=2 Tax=Clostridium perfringens TaxID=1502 RepID=UPI001CC7FC55|nr:phage tail spike protein [Clostridium perfringens]CAG9359155.1 KID repeat-containing protein [Clostridium perfringens]